MYQAITRFKEAREKGKMPNTVCFFLDVKIIHNTSSKIMIINGAKRKLLKKELMSPSSQQDRASKAIPSGRQAQRRR